MPSRVHTAAWRALEKRREGSQHAKRAAGLLSLLLPWLEEQHTSCTCLQSLESAVKSSSSYLLLKFSPAFHGPSSALYLSSCSGVPFTVKLLLPLFFALSPSSPTGGFSSCMHPGPLPRTKVPRVFCLAASHLLYCP